jgi:hypothetical protein
MKNAMLYRVKSFVAAVARRSHVLCLTWRSLRLERSGRLGCNVFEPRSFFPGVWEYNCQEEKAALSF